MHMCMHMTRRRAGGDHLCTWHMHMHMTHRRAGGDHLHMPHAHVAGGGAAASGCDKHVLRRCRRRSWAFGFDASAVLPVVGNARAANSSAGARSSAFGELAYATNQ